MVGDSTVAAQAADDAGSRGYSMEGGAGASLAVRSGHRGHAIRLPRARRNGYRSSFVNDDARTFTPLGDGVTWGNLDLGFPGQLPSGSSGGDGGGSGFDWSQVFGVITRAGPAIISAARGQGVPRGYYPAAVEGQQVRYEQIPAGYRYENGQLVQGGAGVGAQAGAGIENLANSVGTFVTQNPLIVLGGVVALALLFKSPPSRR